MHSFLYSPFTLHRMTVCLRSCSIQWLHGGAMQSLHKPFGVRFRPSDPNCHPIHGKKRSCTGFLLKCKRKRNHKEDTGGHFKAEVLAVVNTVVEFSGKDTTTTAVLSHFLVFTIVLCLFQKCVISRPFTRDYTSLPTPKLFQEMLTKSPVSCCTVTSARVCVHHYLAPFPGLLNGRDITSSSPLFLPPLLFNKFSTPMNLK